MPLSDAEVALKWEDEAQLLPFTAADRVQTAAQTWNGYISALLGVVGLAGVTFVPSSVDRVAGPFRALVLGLGAGVILLGLLAVVCSALAAGVSTKTIWTDGTAYRQAVKQKAETGAQLLNSSRWLTFAALACLLLAAGVSTLNPDTTPASTLVVALQGSGPALCGKPVTGTDGVVALKISGTDVPLRNLTALLPVERCPGTTP